eukprot:1536088-Pleurochrysis_carterae.AAC.1
MEQRLSAMKANLAAEREERNAARKSNPTGSTWRSSRTDLPISGAYVEQAKHYLPWIAVACTSCTHCHRVALVLRKGPAAGGKAGPGKCLQRFHCKDPPASLVSAPSAAGADSGSQLAVGGAAF